MIVIMINKVKKNKIKIVWIIISKFITYIINLLWDFRALELIFLDLRAIILNIIQILIKNSFIREI